MKFNNSELSRALSHALRHEPWLYELELDEEGWIAIEILVEALRKISPEWRNLSIADIERVVELSEKKRHEILNGKIRALYGHSLPGKLSRIPAMPPVILYHGTSKEAAEKILKEGIHPMQRQYVHLSVDMPTAILVGKRKASSPVILEVNAARAYRAGTQFYEGNRQVWLADYISPEYCSLLSES